MRLKVYNTDNTVLIPGSGTYGMEAVARQFGEGRKVLVIRNGYFSYRWSQLFDSMAGNTDVTVMKVRDAPRGRVGEVAGRHAGEDAASVVD